VDEIGSGSFRVRLSEDDIVHASKEFPLQVWPERIEVESIGGESLSVYDPSGRVALDRLGLADWTLLSGTPLIAPDTGQILLVGPGAKLDDRGRGNLLQFVREGGRALVLEENQEALPEAVGEYEPVFFDLPQSWFAYKNGTHPMTASLSADDLRDWGNDNTILAGRTRNLAMGNSRTPIVSGCGGGILLDLPIGKGRMVVSHLLLGAKSSTHPIAAKVLASGIDYLANSTPPENREGILLGPEISSLVLLFEDLGVAYDRYSGDNGGLPMDDRPVFIDASDSDWFGETGSRWLSDLIEAGTDENRTVVVWGLDSSGADLVEPLVSDEIEVVAADHPFLIPTGELMEGVYPETTYWIEGFLLASSVVASGMRIEGASSRRSDFLVAPSFDWRSLVFEAETTRTSSILRSERESPPTPLSALSEYKVGGVSVVLSWLRMDRTPMNRALVSNFLTNLGIEIDPFDPIPDLVGDGKIDWRDLFEFSTGWRSPIGAGRAADRSDFNGDGEVCPEDLLEWLGQLQAGLDGDSE